MSDLPTTPAKIGPTQLTEYLHESGHLPAGRVAAVESDIVGTGKMGENARFTLTYEGAEGDPPASVIGKFPAADETARAMASSLGAYYNEVMFYRELAAGTPMKTPEIYWSGISDDRTQFLLLMEDLAPAEPGSQLVGESRHHAARALGEAARLASAYYGNESLADRDHVMSPARDDGGRLGQTFLEGAWPGFVERFGDHVSAECLTFAERYVANHTHFVMSYEGPRTLVHGDFRSENILFGSDTATTVDWQTVSEAGPLTDAAYFMGGSVEIDDRREWERELIEEYREHLARGGVTLSAPDCWDLYRESAMHGLMITILGASFSTPDPRGDRMFLAMIQRHLQHCVDLHAGDFLP